VTGKDRAVGIGTDLLTERLLRVIDEGRRVATYKLALLLALVDAAALHPGEVRIPTRAIAGLVLDTYYPQTRVYVANDGIERELRQITAKGSPPLRAVLRLRLHGDAAGCRSAADTSDRIPEEYERALAVVEDTFVRYPIPLLQVVGTQLVPFLYSADWPEGTSVATLRRSGRDHVTFLDGVPDRLIVLGPLVRPLIELHWARDVARWTGVATEDDRLLGHLFGVERTSFPASIRAGLAELQGGACFYCGAPLTGPNQVDHFLAWSRWANDAIENLVLADRCNGFKSDHLAAPEHLDRWADRSQRHGHDLIDLARAARWPTEPGRSVALVRSTYGHVPAGTPLWVQERTFLPATGPIEVRI
jgi:5-methylcytosine-specific restriction endonuclease McrA